MTEEPDSQDLTPAINLAAEAVAKLREVAASQQKPIAGLRLQIIGRQGGEFQHVLSLVEEGAENASDITVEAEGLKVFVERTNARYLDGLSVNYRYKGPSVSGLEYANPNPLWFGEQEMEIQILFDTEINPAIAAHGGYVNLLGVEGDTAYVQLGGGCQGCGMADVTLKQGIEAAILESVEGIARVIDETDHEAGENPYYQPSKK
jgi:Fe/S biogenesis protein NfuA